MAAFFNTLQRHLWYSRYPFVWLFAPVFLPLSLLFYGISQLRRSSLQKAAHSQQFNFPIVVVGNISVGGTGKTPVVIAIAEYLKAKGYQPAVISRGYGGDVQATPLLVDVTTSPKQCGDEPLLIKQRVGCPVLVCPDRVASLQYIQKQLPQVDIVISDDGLQHYKMPRDIELAIIDGQRGVGNGWVLPMGPLRETVSRLKSVDMVICNQSSDVNKNKQTVEKNYVKKQLSDIRQLAQDFYNSSLSLRPLMPLNNSQTFSPPLPSQPQSVHAVAAIGNPSRFFMTLRDQGYEVVEHPFPDHYYFSQQDVNFKPALPIIMTEKDAIKCSQLTIDNAWVLPVNAELPDAFWQQLQIKLDAVKQSKQTT